MNLNFQRDHWKSFIQKATQDELASNLNASWNPNTQTFNQHTPLPKIVLDTLQGKISHNKVLDFGVGLGRNYNYLKSLFATAHGYDLPEMLARNTIVPKDNLFSNLDTLPSDYDLVYEVTVMQHMPPQEVLFCLQQLARKSKYYFTHTRSYNDFCRDFDNKTGGINMYSLVASTNVWRPLIQTPGKLADLNDESHHFVLYKSKLIP